ncbi:MAG: DNA cytosine methyltransferase [Sphingobacteriales bacterium]
MTFKKKEPKPKVISLFCGAGGLDLGFKEDGYTIALAIDYESSAIDTHKHNFSSTKSIVADLTELGPEGVLSIVKENIEVGERLGIIGGPPCQGFSRGNIGSQPDDPRNALPQLYVDIIGKLQKEYIVEFVIFENVMGMKDKKHSQKYLSLIQGLKDLKLDVTEKELCAIDYGVPQKRNRIIVSALRTGQGYKQVVPEKRSGPTTVKQVIGDLPNPIFFDRALKPSDIPNHPNHWTMKPKSVKFQQIIGDENKTRSFRKLKWDKASPTIAFGNREIHIHPEGKRRLSIYEAMLLQGFPRAFELKGNLSQQVQQISNAVPPPLAKSLAAAVTKSMNG